MMDTALQLRLAVEKKQPLTETEIEQMLSQSDLIQHLTAEPFSDNRLALIFKLAGLAEIPYIQRLNYTQELLALVEEKLATPEGFSYTGVADGIVPCYNGMVLEAYSRLGLAQSESAQNALRWIKKYQLFERNQTTSWQGKGIKQHGGCLNRTPCYIGIGKTMRALLTYNETLIQPDPEVSNLINKGTAYMLKHQWFLRLSEKQPINKYITSSMFPQNYFLSLTDLIYIIGKTGTVKLPESSKIMRLLNEKQLDKNQWKIEHIYSYKGYNSFETRRRPSEWLSHLYPLWLAENS